MPGALTLPHCVVSAERKAREEEERLRKEAEEARLEAERRLREEQERLRREEEERRRREELDRLNAEHAEMAVSLADMSARLSAAQVAEARDSEWSKFLECSPLPDASREADVNTYLSVWSERETLGLEETLESCQQAEGVSRLLEESLATACASGDEARAATGE